MGRAWLVAVGVSVSVVLAVGSASTVASAGSRDSGVRCSGAVLGAVEASAQARACGRSVEVLGERTAWNTTYALASGQMQVVASAAAVRTDVSGSWEPVDRTVVVGSDGFEVASPVVAMHFSDGSDDAPLARVARDGHEMTFDVPFDLPRPTAVEDQLVYSAVLPGVDLIVSVNADATGFSEVLRVESAAAAADPRLRELQFPITTSDGLRVDEAQGGFEAVEESGEPVFWGPAPQMWDSSRGSAAERVPAGRALVGSALSEAMAASGATDAETDLTVAPSGAEVIAVMPVSVQEDSITIVPEEEMFSDPGTVWPVYIDPSVSGSRNSWVVVRSALAPKWGFTGDEGVGRCQTNTYMTCNPNHSSRILWRFASLESVGALDEADVTGATFSAFGVHSYNCTDQPVTLYQIDDFNSSVGWPGGGLWNPLDTQRVSHKATCSSQRWIGWNATAIARDVARVNASVMAVGLAADESSNVGWKRYRYDATMSVTFNRAPSAPTGVAISSPAVGCGAVVNTSTPIFTASVSDPDGDNVYAHFNLTRSDGTAVWGVDTDRQASGTQFGVQVPANVLQDNVGYKFRVVGVDSTRVGVWSGECAFTANTVAPGVAPVVSPVTGQPAVYAEGGRAGGVGLTGKFTFGPNGVSDVSSFKYGFDDSAMTSTAAVGVQVSYTPATAGPHTLYVQSVDVGGLTGPRRDYTFYVDVVTGGRAWLFNESGSVTTAVDAFGGPALTLSSAGLRVAGVVRELDPASAPANDGALRFASAVDQAVTAVPVVATDRAYSVGAFVKLSDLTGSQVAVAQAGVTSSAFELGYRSGTGSGCATSAGCWAFTVYGSDSAAATATVVASSVPVVAGQWVYIAGAYDPATHLVAVSVCDPGGEPSAPVTAPFTASWYATSGLVVGRGKAGGAVARNLHGTVDNVAVMEGVADLNLLRRLCSGSTTL